MRLLSDLGLLAAMICTSMISAARAAAPAAKEKVQSAAPAKDQRIATILATKVLCKQPGRYIGWPSIAQAPNGDLLAVFSGDREAHVSPDGKTQMVRSSDGGKTWSEPVTINDLTVDDRDAGILRTAKGTMLVSWFTGPPYGSPLEGNYVIRSSDNGKTWSQPIRTQVTTPHGPIQLADGRLLTIGQRPHCSHTRGSGRAYDGPPGTTAYTVSIEESRDDGLSWTVISTFPVPKDAKMLSFDEAHMVEIEPGKLVALYGLAPDMDPIMALARQHGLAVIEDDAQCFLGRYKGRVVGSIGNLASFSFQNSKHITCGEGGMIVTDDRELADRVARFASLGYGLVSAGAGKSKIDKRAILWYLCTSASDQIAIQRYLATKDAKAARTVLFVSLASDGLVTLLLALVGLGLLAYFHAYPSLLPEGSTVLGDADKLLSQFIVVGLPVGISGLVVAGLLACAMSSLAAGISSTCSVITVDILDRLRPANRSCEAGRVRQLRYVSVFVGAIVVALSLGVNLVQGNLLEVCYKVVNLLTAPLAGLFFLAMFVPRARGFGALVGAACGLTVVVAVSYWKELTGSPGISFLWAMPLGLLVEVGVGALVSLLPIGRPPRSEES